MGGDASPVKMGSEPCTRLVAGLWPEFRQGREAGVIQPVKARKSGPAIRYFRAPSSSLQGPHD
jgi:hypothetical protein